MKRTFDVSTKQDKDSPAKATKLTVVYPDGLPTWVMDGYDAFLVVKLQTSWRTKGIPANLEVQAEKLAPGTRAPAQTPEQVFAALSPAEREAIFKKYSGK